MNLHEKSIPPPFVIRQRRISRGWTQGELAACAGLSRAGVSAIEAGRLSPSVAAALALAKALDGTVEELFGRPPAGTAGAIDWALPPAGPGRRYWLARIADRLRAYAVEDDSPQLDWHDGVEGREPVAREAGGEAERTLVIACCDPAAPLLAAEYRRQFAMRLIVLRRNSAAALDLLAGGLVHAAGLHLAPAGDRPGNRTAARARLGTGFRLVRVARWEEGIAFHPRLGAASGRSLARAGTRWVGREAGSGARQCQDLVLAGRLAPRHEAFDHRSVTAAIRSGWADAGPCVRLAAEEAGLRFHGVRQECYDLCYPGPLQDDPRLAALVATLRSRRYRERLGELPGYSTASTGETVA